MSNLPAHQDIDAIGKIGSKICDICGGPDGNIWLHCDSWTKWMRYGCGCNVTYCEKCKDLANGKAKELRAINRAKAEKAEKEMLKDINHKTLARLRHRYFDDFNCSKEFRDWVESVVGKEKMEELLDVKCDCCGKLLSQTKYFFEDKEGKQSQKTIDEIETYCYEAVGRNPKTEPFKTGFSSLSDDFRIGCSDKQQPEIAFQSAIWDYCERNNLNSQDMDSFHKAFNATKGVDCGGTGEWSYGYFVYYMPTKTYLGKFRKYGGDWVQIIQTNRKKIEEEQERLRERYGDKYSNNKDFWEEYRSIDEKVEYSYFCSKNCNKINELEIIFI